MKVGLIAPIPHLSEYATGDFHLVLLHLLLQQPGYRHHYNRLTLANPMTHIVVDNSAFELGAGLSVNELLDQAIYIGAREICIPDVMHDAQGTIERAAMSIRTLYSNRRKDLRDHLIQLMIIPHGKTIYQWGQCLEAQVQFLDDMFPNDRFTIGIPKDYETWPGGRMSLIARFVEQYRRDRDMDVHLLGVNNLNAITAMRLQYPWIRSTDSVKPFTYARAGLVIPPPDSSTPVPHNPGRPEDFFTTRIRNSELLATNVDAFVRRITGEKETV